MAISTSTNNNLSKFFAELLYWLALPTSDLYGHFSAFSLRETIRHRATQQCSSVMINKRLEGEGGGGKLTKPFWADTSSRFSRTPRGQNTKSGYIEERASKSFFTLKIGAVNCLHEIGACLRIKINNKKNFTWRHPRLSLGSPCLNVQGCLNASCWDWQDFYIGKTKRGLHDRKTEHFKIIRLVFDCIGTHSYLYSKCIIQVYSYKSVAWKLNAASKWIQ